MRLVTYCTYNYYSSALRLRKSAKKFGISNVQIFTDDWLRRTSFYKMNEVIFKNDKGGGYWIWKPFIIADQLSRLEENEILVYSDSGIEIIGEFNTIVEEIKRSNGFGCFQTYGFTNEQYIKKYCLYKMGCDSTYYLNAPMIMGGFLILVNNQLVREVINEWMELCMDYDLVSDNLIPYQGEHERFREHRHDQSILTLICLKRKIRFFREPTQFAKDEVMGDSSFTKKFDIQKFLYHHRTRIKPSYWTLLKIKALNRMNNFKNS